MYHLQDFVDAQWRTNASADYAIIGLNDGLVPVPHQTITLSNDGMWPIGLLALSFSEIHIKIKTYSFQENWFESDLCIMAALWCQ